MPSISREKSLWIITVGFAVLLVLMIALGFVALTALRSVDLNLQGVVEVTNSKIASAHAMRDAIRLRAISLREARLTDDPFIRDDLFQGFIDYAGVFRRASEKLMHYGLDAREGALYERFRAIAREAQPVNFQAMQLIQEGVDGPHVINTLKEASRLQQLIAEVLGDLIELEIQYAKEAREESVREYLNTRNLFIGISLLILILGAGIAITVIRTVHRGTRRIHYQARHDALTSLFNRHEFEGRLDKTIAQARLEGGHHVLLYMDLDNFKIINDTCGHAAGDTLLKDLGQLLHDAIRSTDTLARLGGDEFGVILSDCDVESAQLIAEKLRQVVDGYHLLWEGETFSVGVSIGLVAIDNEVESHAEVMKHADIACYAAKDMGRNQVHVYTHGDDNSIARDNDLRCVGCLRDALANDGFRLYAQYIQPLNEAMGEGLHAEILLRLERDGEVILPATFLPPAERLHMMPEIDRWVISHVIEWMRSDNSRLESIHTLHINLSGASLNDPSFLDYLENTLSAAGSLTSRLGFEITENIAIHNLEETCRLIARLRQHGCRVSLDDFGVGMSSFVYLKTMDVDAVKIDGEFVKGILEDKVDHEIVYLINEFCHTMGIRTVAEYVESAEVMSRLSELEVDCAQGNYIMPAAPLESLFSPGARAAAV